MMAIALGVLVLTALVTAGLAHRPQVTDCTPRRAGPAPTSWRPSLDDPVRQLPRPRPPAAPSPGAVSSAVIRDLVNTTLRVSNGAVVAIDADGDVQEVLGRLLGTPGRVAAHAPRGRDRRRPRHRHAARRATQTGRDGDTVFVAQPLAAVGDVHARAGARRGRRDTRPFGGSGLAVLVAAAVALGVAALVAVYLARRHDPPARGDGDDRAVDRRRRPVGPGRRSTDVPDDELAEPRRRDQRDGRASSSARAGTSARSSSASRTTCAPRSPRSGATPRRSPTAPSHGRRRGIRAADVIAAEARRLERLVADLLDLARLDAHQFSLTAAVIDARERSSDDGRGVPSPAATEHRRRARGRRRRARAGATPIPNAWRRSWPTWSRTR